MRFFFFHLMPYAEVDLAAIEAQGSSWVRLPNTHYDPEKGAQLYHRYLDEMERAEALGFDGVGVNEHHQTAYGMMPSPIVIASALVRRTTTAKICILGSALPLRQHPLTVAEEHAMIDNISGGRLISGFVRGIGAEYHVFGVNPTESHDRFHEAHDLIIRAWTEPGPFEFSGKYYRHRYVNLWPRPYQRPHPPVWIPSQGSQETIDFAAHPDRRYTYLHTFSPSAAVAKYMELYRQRAEEYGYTASTDQLGWAVPIYVGDTDKSAGAEAKTHFENFRNRFAKMPIEFLLPPGYTSLDSMKRVAAAKQSMFGDITLETAAEAGMMIYGSAATVRDRLVEYQKQLGFRNLLTLLQFGTLPADLTAASMERFAGAVMPALREIGEEEASP
jgi:alkanesulfonate monooxygenase SsuD/methylene tetrahydromethanopterin reductase-like flavin-dependent oxidoreductase (luciferase family)